MSRVFIPAPHNNLLTGLKEPAEVCDCQGNVLGYFTPVQPGEKRVPWEPPPMTEEELQRIEDDPREYTTEQVLAELEKL